MLTILIWVLIIALFILSFAGIIYPLIPSPLVLWIGFLLYHFIINPEKLTIVFWLLIGILTVILVVSDIIVNSYFVKKFGGSKWGERGAGIAVIIGSFIVPPFGILILPVITVFTIEMVQRRTVLIAFYASIGSFIGFLSGAVAKGLIQFVMIIWFFIIVLF